MFKKLGKVVRLCGEAKKEWERHGGHINSRCAELREEAETMANQLNLTLKFDSLYPNILCKGCGKVIAWSYELEA
jgi:hypothetical protein